MIYYPLSTLMLAGIRDILLVTTPHEHEQFVRLLGDGSRFGISLTYAEQKKPEGLAQAFLLGEEHIRDQKCALILGDNIFHGSGLGATLERMQEKGGATIFAYQVSNPEDYGVVEFDEVGQALSLEEKPAKPKSNFAIPGLYFYDENVTSLARSLKPSSRGELEITDLNKLYLDQGQLFVERLERGTAWLDTGTVESLLSASEFVKVIESRQGMRIGVPEEVAWRKGFIDVEQLLANARAYSKSGYGKYLFSLVE
jgi:glucose-1-phosphate thymidylyltransferase